MLDIVPFFQKRKRKNPAPPTQSIDCIPLDLHSSSTTRFGKVCTVGRSNPTVTPFLNTNYLLSVN
ncbi:unnamed protein product, partial [Vitis vinifera]|uniref:Uncharacterized protein n=1 Tax=Vitis vinifera TaxID=29760 RepID=D7TEJ6_VITVI